MKIYPTALLRGTELYALWEQGAYRPYEEAKTSSTSWPGASRERNPIVASTA